MLPIKVLDSVANAVVDAATITRRHSLPPETLARRFREMRRESTAREARLARFRNYRHRWLQLSDEEIVEIAQRRRRGSSGGDSAMNNG